MPVVEFTITANGSMTVTVDGEAYQPEPFAPGWRREAFPTILDALTAQYRSPLRVQVHEADGSTFTDIITPPRERPTPKPWQPTTPAAVSPPVPAAQPVLHQVAGAGSCRVRMSPSRSSTPTPTPAPTAPPAPSSPQIKQPLR